MSVMPEQNHKEMSLLAAAPVGVSSWTSREITTTLCRRKWLFLGLFATIAALTLLFALFLPNQYQSRMKILVKNTRADVLITPERTNSPNVSGEVTETQINSEIALLTSKDLLEQVVRQSGLDKQASAAFLKCAVTNHPYTIFGYSGKQVRDNIHSYDLVRMFEEFIENPRCGAVYNAGGGRDSNCSMLEAVEMCEELTGNKMKLTYSTENRIGDHIWYISNLRKFKQHYPRWNSSFTVPDILAEIYRINRVRWTTS